jgi:hypothetical protein
MPLQGITANDMYRFVTHHVNKRNSVLKWLQTVSTDSLYEKQTSPTSMKLRVGDIAVEVEASTDNSDEEDSMTTVDEVGPMEDTQGRQSPEITVAPSRVQSAGTTLYHLEGGRVIIPKRPMSVW